MSAIQNLTAFHGSRDQKIWALLPLKNLDAAKQRLSQTLSREERRGLVQAMAKDVLEALQNHPKLAGTLLISDTDVAASLSDQFRFDFISETELGAQRLNGVVAAGVKLLAERGIDDVMVVHGDLPLITAKEVSQMIDKHLQNKDRHESNPRALTIARDARGQGSNVLICSPARDLEYRYGEYSLQEHCKQAEERNFALRIESFTGLSHDIDWPEDLDFLMAHSGKDTARHTHQFLAGSGITARRLAANTDMSALMEQAKRIRDRKFRNLVTYSRKVFIPLTQLCRDVCHYCTFAQTPKKLTSPFMTTDQVLASVREAETMGCKEVLFTLGERPEERYQAARDFLAANGFKSTLEYLAHVAGKVVEETGALPHINAGCMSAEEIEMLRPVSASMGIMLESASERLCEKSMPHYGSPDKNPERRLETIRLAGEAQVPFTSGILIGIGETRRERVDALVALKELHEQYGHIQEIIVQNFRAKPGTKMADAPEPELDELLWTIAVARIIFGPDMNIQAPPNLSPGVLTNLIDAGINDWGGVSPITPDFVNPEAPWPHLEKLTRETVAAGKFLQERLTIYSDYVRNGEYWLDPRLQTRILRMVDAEGYPRTDDWLPGQDSPLPEGLAQAGKSWRNENVIGADLRDYVAKSKRGVPLDEFEIVRLFQARGPEFSYLCDQANQLRQQVNGNLATYVVNRNINYTNICYFKCQFCAFSKGKLSENLRGRPYDLDHGEIAERAKEAWSRGATEVCMQGGIHPKYTGQTYLDILDVIRSATPDMHIHAFSPLEVWQGAETLGISVRDFLSKLKDAGLRSLPGTAAEVLDDEVRERLCPDKINTEQWLQVVETAHELGLPSTATIMFGHIDSIEHWARHLIRIRELQRRTGGFTELVPLPFVALESPIYLKGKSRQGPTFREALLMHAVARLVLHGWIDNIQTSWVKMGDKGMEEALNAGANDLGGTLMNESITRSAGATHGQERTPAMMDALICRMGREPRQRTTLYQDVPPVEVGYSRFAEPQLEEEEV